MIYPNLTNIDKTMYMANTKMVRYQYTAKKRALWYSYILCFVIEAGISRKRL